MHSWPMKKFRGWQWEFLPSMQDNTTHYLKQLFVFGIADHLVPVQSQIHSSGWKKPGIK